MCCISGPYCPGVYCGLDIFQASIMSHLEAFEWLEADDGYVAEAPLKGNCPKCLTIPEDRKAMMQKGQAWQETINKRFKQWFILKQCFSHDLSKHHDVFAAIAVISQVAVENGEPLFDVEYSDPYNF